MPVVKSENCTYKCVAWHRHGIGKKTIKRAMDTKSSQECCSPVMTSVTSPKIIHGGDSKGGGSVLVDEEGCFKKNKQGGWKTMPFIIGNETCEKLATIGLLSNVVVYLTKMFNMPNVSASYVINLWSGTTNMAPLVGAYLSDSYLGRYWTIAIGCIASFIGMVLLTLTATFPQFRPAQCANPGSASCEQANAGQRALLYSALAMMTIGAGGIRPCSVAFGADQFDYKSEKGRRSIESFFNWYYFTFTAAVMVSVTVIVYIQDNISWSWGMLIPTSFMLIAIICFFIGKHLYIMITPQGSPFTSFAQVMVAAYKKRHLNLPTSHEQAPHYYDGPDKSFPIGTLPLTDQFRFLNKAAMQEETELKEDGRAIDPWRLSTVQQVEELKSVLRIIPVWAGCIGIVVTTAQLGTFSVLEAQVMDRSWGKHFKVPEGSFSVFTMLGLTAFVPLYDRVIAPWSRKLTKNGQGLTQLQRIGIGQVISVVPMVAAALVEVRRRHAAIAHGLIDKPHGVVPMSAMWLVPQYAIAGVAEAFVSIGQIEFLYSQFPADMRSVAGAMFFLGLGLGNYISSLVVKIVHSTTPWLNQNLNRGKLDCFYWMLAVFTVVNIVYFVIVAMWYRYKTFVDPTALDTELTPTTVGKDKEKKDAN